MKHFSILVLLIFSFLGCSGKKYFSPSDSNFFKPNKVITTGNYIKNFTLSGATLENQTFISNKGISNFSLPSGYDFLTITDETLIANSKQNKLFLQDKNGTQTIIDMQRYVISASKEKNLLALVFSDNTIALYDLNNKTYKMREYGQHSYLNDIRIASPKIVDNLILYPTLDGKLILVSKNTSQIIRTINVDPDGQVNNIILLTLIDNTLIAASQNKIISIKNNLFKSKDLTIQSYLITKDGYIYLAGHDGVIYKYDNQLQLLANIKFKFAKIFALNNDSDNNIYGLELGGYLIKLTNDLKKPQVYNFPFENDEKTFAYTNKIYFENKILFLDTKTKQ